MQFAVGRNETYPKLSVRRKENNVLSGWEGFYIYSKYNKRSKYW
jgi:hypothetical protein